MWVGRVKGHCTLTGVHPADLLNEGLIKTCDNSAAYWNHEVLVQALHKGVDPPDTSALRTQTGSHPNAPAAPRWRTSVTASSPVVSGACTWTPARHTRCSRCVERRTWRTWWPVPPAWGRLNSGQEVLTFDGTLGARQPVWDARGEAGSCGMNTQDVLSSEFLDLLFHGAQVGPKLIALQKVLDHHRFETCSGISLRCFGSIRGESDLKRTVLAHLR